MPLIENGRVIEDGFVTVADDSPIPSDRPAIISLQRWRDERETFHGRNARIGVRVPSDVRARDLADHLDGVSLVALEFPKFRDGRAFTTARELRERWNFTGEIRAVGHVIADQYQHLLRTGFNTVELPEGAKPEQWEAAQKSLTVAFQPSGDETQQLNPLARRLNLGG